MTKYLLPFLSVFFFACGGSDTHSDTGAATEVETAPIRKPKTEVALSKQEVSYMADSVVMKGYIAYDKNREGQRPGVLVVHEWWGHNEHARNSADYLASLGYTALAVDMYGNGKQADHPADAGSFSSAVMSDFDGAMERFKAAKTLLEEHPTVNAESIGAVGYCFGGGIVLNMARQGVDLDGVVSIHGSLNAVEPADSSMTTKILVLTGADDPFVPEEARENFKAEMMAAGADFELIEYPGALHAFSNPKATEMGETFELPLAYNAAADSLSKLEMKAFFEGILK